MSSKSLYSIDQYYEDDDDDEYEQEYIKRKYSDIFAEETEQQLSFDETAEIKDGLDYLTRESAFQKRRGGFHYKSLDVSERGLCDLNTIEHFASLRSLNVSKNYLTDMHPLGYLPYLIKIDASFNQVAKFLELHSARPLPLREANFSRNKIEELVELRTFWALSIVNLSYNKLKLVDGFQECHYLRVLNLSHNEISELNNMNIPSLVILLLKDNQLTSIKELEGCQGLRYLNISNNKITDLSWLTKMPRLMELRAQDNKIELMDLEYMKSLIYLSHLWIRPNPCMEVGMSRLMLIFMLPHLQYLDGRIVTPEEILDAKNVFSPTFSKLAFEDHTNILLDKACQSGNAVFDEFCRTYPAPPILLLVGSAKSNIQELAASLKEKFKYHVMIGGVHSTATTIESGDHIDNIPISMASFTDMKSRGEFLATSHILGRICGFASSQIARASERGALLIASVPLGTAIALRKWRLNPKMVLVLPSQRPHFNVDEFLEAEAEKEKGERQSFTRASETTTFHEHKIKFASRVAIPDSVHEYQPDLETQSILKTESTSFAKGLNDVEWSEQVLTAMSGKGPESGQEKKKKTEFKEVKGIKFENPKTQINENVQEIESVESIELEELNFEDEEAENDEELEEKVVEDLAVVVSSLQSPFVKEAPPFTLTNGLPRLQRLASLLLLQSGEIPSTHVSEMIMALQRVQQPIDLDSSATIDWKRIFLQNNELLNRDEGYYKMIQDALLFTDANAQFQDAVIAPTKKASLIEDPASAEFQIIVTQASDEMDNKVTQGDGDGQLGTPTPSYLRNVSFSENNIQESKIDLDFEAEEKIRSRKPTKFIPSAQRLDIDDDDDDEEILGENEEFQPEEKHLSNQDIGELIKDESNDSLNSEESPSYISNEEGESHYHNNRFKHRDAMEKAILKTREEYHEFHLDNPGFFTEVLDTTDFVKCDRDLEALVDQILDEFKHKNIDAFKNVTYAGEKRSASHSADESHFVKHRLDQLKWCNHEWNIGYQHPLQHMKNKYPKEDNDGSVFFKRSICPKKLLEPKLSRRYSEAKFKQLQTAGEMRRKRIEKANMKKVINQENEHEEEEEGEIEGEGNDELNLENSSILYGKSLSEFSIQSTNEDYSMYSIASRAEYGGEFIGEGLSPELDLQEDAEDDSFTIEE